MVWVRASSRSNMASIKPAASEEKKEDMDGVVREKHHSFLYRIDILFIESQLLPTIHLFRITLGQLGNYGF